MHISDFEKASYGFNGAGRFKKLAVGTIFVAMPMANCYDTGMLGNGRVVDSGHLSFVLLQLHLSEV